MKKQIFFFLSIILLIVSFNNYAKEKFVLMTMLYNETNEKRIAEYKECINKNISHSLIEEMYVLYDISKDDNNNELFSYLVEQDITITKIKGRATYADFFNLANELYPDQKIILSNADIYFDETLELLLDYDFNNTFLALTRYETDKKTGEQDIRRFGSRKRIDSGSQDTWIFKTPIYIFEADKVCMGILGCDNAIVHKAFQQGYKVINPCLTIKCFHNHLSGVRNYGRSKCKEPFKKINGSTLYS